MGLRDGVTTHGECVLRQTDADPIEEGGPVRGIPEAQGAHHIEAGLPQRVEPDAARGSRCRCKVLVVRSALRRLRLGVREGSAVEVVGGLRGLASDRDELTDSVLRS